VIPTEQILVEVRQLPTLSATTGRLWALVRDPGSSSADFEQVIRPDLALTANLLKVANSAYFGLRTRVESVRHAVTMLGLKRVAELAASASFAPVIPKHIPGYDMDAAGFWLHSVAVAVLAERLAFELACGTPDMLFTAGLLHDVGKLAVGTYVARGKAPIRERMLDGRPFVLAEREVIGHDHAEIGAAVAEAWNLPRPARWAIRWHHRPSDADGGVDRRLVALVHAADALSHQLGFGADAGELAREIDTGVQERLGVNVRRLEAVASDSLDAIREMGALFQSPGGSP
jgi:putative nucleotidyltransferase with HDIG domain